MTRVGAVRADYAELLITATPLIDLRAPGEFAKGAFEAAVNLPLLNDDERAAVGTEYKARGQEAAVELGEQLVSGDVRAARLRSWIDHLTRHPQAVLYCWRGGLRSAIAQQWLAEAGVSTPRLADGYKGLRQFCLASFESSAASLDWRVLAGRTGSGKTRLLARLERHVDLEALAHHRGSAFGGRGAPQPTPIDFDSALAAACLRCPNDKPIAIEDESRTIGRLAIPEPLFAAMQQAPVVLLETNLAARVENIYQEYVAENPTAHAHLGAALDRIQKRLGGARHREVRSLLDTAFDHADRNAHSDWIERLLAWYYDPMYDYQMEKKASRIEFRGDFAAVETHLSAD